jgi:hypothetical protein
VRRRANKPQNILAEAMEAVRAAALAEAAQERHDRVSARVKASKALLRAQGRHQGGGRQFGYRLVPVPAGGARKEVLDKAEQAAIKDIVRLRKEGWSLMRIRDEMRARGHWISHQLVANTIRRHSGQPLRQKQGRRPRQAQPPVSLVSPPAFVPEVGVPAITTKAEPDPALGRIHEVLAGLRNDVQGMRQQRRDQGEHGPMILRRLTELERLVRGDPGLAQVPRSTRRRPLGAE